jgi:Protein of unknown function (DUF4199)
MEQTTTTQTALKWGAITGLISIVLAAISFVMNLDSTDSPIKYLGSILGLLVSIVVLIMAMKEFKSANGGFMSYGQGLGIGAMIGGISGVISGIFSYIYLKFIDTTHMETVKNFQISKMEEQGMSQDQIDAGMKYADMFTGPATILAFSVIGGVIFYFIISLIISAIQKNEKPVFE